MRQRRGVYALEGPGQRTSQSRRFVAQSLCKTKPRGFFQTTCVVNAKFSSSAQGQNLPCEGAAPRRCTPAFLVQPQCLPRFQPLDDLRRKISTSSAIQTANAHDVAFGIHKTHHPFAREFAATVHRQRARFVKFVVGTRKPAVKHEIGRDVAHGHTQLARSACDHFGTDRIHHKRFIAVFFRAVHVGVSGAIHDEMGIDPAESIAQPVHRLSGAMPQIARRPFDLGHKTTGSHKFLTNMFPQISRSPQHQNLHQATS